jgi:hypothetical protein
MQACGNEFLSRTSLADDKNRLAQRGCPGHVFQHLQEYRRFADDGLTRSL